jgi:hypothetical protein
VGGRLRRAERRDHLLHMLNLRWESAGCAAEFRAHLLARELGVSVVWFYALVGEEYKKMRASLPGALAVNDDSVTSLRREVERLRVELRGLKSKYEEKLRAKLAKAITHIELLDSENRILREKVADLERSLYEGLEG